MVWLVLVAQFFAVVSALNCTVASRKDCGYSGINQQQCEAKGCCWGPVNPNPENEPWCFYPNDPTPSPAPSPAPTPAPMPPSPPSPAPGPPSPLPGCNIFNDNQCSGQDITTPDIFASRTWQTPHRGSKNWIPSFQDYSRLQGYAQVTYSSDHSTANVTVIAITKDTTQLTYWFDGQSQAQPTAHYSSSHMAPVAVKISSSDGSTLQLDPLYFIWTAPKINHTQGDYRNGQKGAIVEMFGWPHAAIETECKFLAEAGYLGVKVFPPQEQVMSVEPFQNVMNPWFFMYQPVSYRLEGRMGSQAELYKMIQQCRSQNVRVYADAVVNHMVGGGNDANPDHRYTNCVYWGAKNSSASFPPNESIASGTSPFYTQSDCYTLNDNSGEPWSQEFPAVPYGPLDFHCERALNSWTDPLDLNAGWLTGLVDLNTERPNVQQRIADYLTSLLSFGFSGFRMDAAKHIKPDDIAAIFGRLKRNLGGSFPDDFISWLEILLGGEADMLLCNPNSGYNYAEYLVTAFQQQGLTASDIDKIKIWYSAYPKEPGADCGKLTMTRKAIQNDDADQQTTGSTSRDMGDQGSVLVIERNVPKHRQFEVELFTNPPGSSNNNDDYPIRMVLSSFYFDLGAQAYGIPDGLSDCSMCTISCNTCTNSMPKTSAYNPASNGYDPPSGYYTRVHRDGAIVAAMRSWMHLSASSD